MEYFQVHIYTIAFFHKIMLAEKIIFLQIHNKILHKVKWFTNVKTINLEKTK